MNVRNRIVLIAWKDSNVTHGWIPVWDDNDKLARCQTAGFVISEDEEKITVSLGVSDCDTTMERLTIPKGCITSIKEMRVR